MIGSARVFFVLSAASSFVGGPEGSLRCLLLLFFFWHRVGPFETSLFRHLTGHRLPPKKGLRGHGVLGFWLRFFAYFLSLPPLY